MFIRSGESRPYAQIWRSYDSEKEHKFWHTRLFHLSLCFVFFASALISNRTCPRKHTLKVGTIKVTNNLWI